MDWIEIAIIATGILGAVAIGLQIHIAIMERRTTKAYRTATAPCNLVQIMGPHPAMTVPIHNGLLAMQAIPVGGYAIVNVENGDIEYSFPRDTNHSMETNFSLDELEEAREFINGGRETALSTLSRRGFIAGLFVAPAIVKVNNIMPVKAIKFITQDTIRYILIGYDVHCQPLTEVMDLPLIDGRFDPLLIEAKRPLFDRITSIMWAEKPSMEMLSQAEIDVFREFPSSYNPGFMRHGRTGVTEEIHGRSPLVDDAGELNKWESFKPYV